MALHQPDIERMLQLGLSGMPEALAEQREIADISPMCGCWRICRDGLRGDVLTARRR